MNQSAIKQIKPDQWYLLADIATKKWIMNMVGKSSKRYLYRLIQANRLPARDFGLGKKQALYRVKGQDVINFIKTNYL